MLSLRSMITVAVTAVLGLGLTLGASPHARAKVEEAAVKARLAAQAALSWAQIGHADGEARASTASQTQSEASAESDLNGTIDSGGQTQLGAGAGIEADAQTSLESTFDLGEFFEWMLEVGLGIGVRSGADAQAGAGS